MVELTLTFRASSEDSLKLAFARLPKTGWYKCLCDGNFNNSGQIYLTPMPLAADPADHESVSFESKTG